MILVLLTAVIGMYMAFKPTGKAYQMTQYDTIGYCCCTDGKTPFKVPSYKITSELTPTDCAITCFEHNAETIGQC